MQGMKGSELFVHRADKYLQVHSHENQNGLTFIFS